MVAEKEEGGIMVGPEEKRRFCCEPGGVFCWKCANVADVVGGARKGEVIWTILAVLVVLGRRQTRSSSLANVRTVGKRCCGSFCNAVITTCSISTGIAGRCRRRGGGGFVTCWRATSVNVP